MLWYSCMRCKRLLIAMNDERRMMTLEDSFLPVTTHKSAVRFNETGIELIEDEVASEYALTIYVNDGEMVTIVCTPDNLKNLVIGFLASEGVIKSIDEIQSLSLVQTRGVARVQIRGERNFNQAFYNKRYIASCCGKSRQSFYFYNDAHTAKVATDTGVRYCPQAIFSFMRQLQDASSIFQSTGGVHSAGLCHPNQGLYLVKSDIGRHNALDKLYGHILETGDNVSDCAIAFTGRLSSEVLLKAAKIGVGILIAKSAPTAMAIEMAESLNMTAIGFARGHQFTAYTHAWRIQRTDTAEA